MSQYHGIYRSVIESESGLFELSLLIAVNNKHSSPKFDESIPFCDGSRFELVVYQGKLEGIHLVPFSDQVESMIVSIRDENKENQNHFTVDQIRSVGWLNNNDKSICLTICLSDRNTPIFVSVSKKEFEDAGGREGLSKDKQAVMDFYLKYGTDRP
jgi:hypothetical protein